MQKAIDTSYVIPPVDKNLILEELKSATLCQPRDICYKRPPLTFNHERNRSVEGDKFWSKRRR